LDGLIQNAGSRFQRNFVDEPLLERLRLLAKDDMVDTEVRQKVNVLFRQWAVAYKDTNGLGRIAILYKELPRTRRPQPHQSRIVRENEAEAERENATSPPTSPTASRRNSQPSRPPQATSSTPRPITLSQTQAPSSSIFPLSRANKKDKKNKGKPFNLEREKGQLLETIASANVASTNLLNGLQLINREVQRVSDNAEVMQRFETCKMLRRQILRYIQLVESDQYIGSLLSANDELVKGLMAFEIMDKSIDDDSDSDTEQHSPPTASMGGLSMQEAPPAKPPRPMSIPMPPSAAAGKQKAEPESEPEEDEDDPFGDSHGKLFLAHYISDANVLQLLRRRVSERSSNGGMCRHDDIYVAYFASFSRLLRPEQVYRPMTQAGGAALGVDLITASIKEVNIYHNLLHLSHALLYTYRTNVRIRNGDPSDSAPLAPRGTATSKRHRAMQPSRRRLDQIEPANNNQVWNTIAGATIAPLPLILLSYKYITITIAYPSHRFPIVNKQISK
jgi:hypothetical protein